MKKYKIPETIRDIKPFKKDKLSIDYVDYIYSRYELGKRILNKEEFSKNYRGTNDIEEEWNWNLKRDKLIRTGQYEDYRLKQYHNEYMKKVEDTIQGISITFEDDEEATKEIEAIKNKFFNLSLKDFSYLYNMNLLPEMKVFYTDDFEQIKNTYREMKNALDRLEKDSE